MTTYTTMYDLLPTKAADYATIPLAIAPSDLTEEGGKTVILRETEDSVIDAIVLQTVPLFTADLDLELLTDSEKNTLFDLYFDPLKGNCGARTLKWTHPLDGHSYVVRLISKHRRGYVGPGLSALKVLQLRVEGKYA